MKTVLTRNGVFVEGVFYKRVLKAYEMSNKEIVEEVYMYDSDTFIVHANTAEEAKCLLFNQLRQECVTDYMGDYIDYVNIRVRRCKDADRYEFVHSDGTSSNMGLFSIHRKISEIERLSSLDKILADTSITHCYISKGGSYYSSGWSGYVSMQVCAGVYDKEAAVRHAKGVDSITLIPVDKNVHNKRLEDFFNERFIN